MSDDSAEPTTVVRLVHDVQLLGIQQTELAARRGSGDVVESIPYSSIDEQTKIDFANDVAILAILPFTRQAIADITARVFGAALLMPIIQRGQLVFGLSDSTEATE